MFLCLFSTSSNFFRWLSVVFIVEFIGMLKFKVDASQALVIIRRLTRLSTINLINFNAGKIFLFRPNCDNNKKPSHWNNFHLRELPFQCCSNAPMILSSSTTHSHCLPFQLNTFGPALSRTLPNDFNYREIQLFTPENQYLSNCRTDDKNGNLFQAHENFTARAN